LFKRKKGAVHPILRMVIKHIFIGLLLLFHLPVSAPENLPRRHNCGLTLSGKISDQHQDEPLPAATIVFEELNQVVQTDVAGIYHFHDLCPGIYHVKTSYVGFDPIRQEVRLTASAIQNLKLHPAANQLDFVQISGYRILQTKQLCCI